MKELNTLAVDGESTVRAYTKGIIPYFEGFGYTLPECQLIAKEWGHLVHEDTVNNLVVTSGLGLVCDALADITTGITHCALGTSTSTPAISDTTLTTEVARKAATTRTRSGAVLTTSTFFTAAESTFAIEEVGLFGSSDATTSADSGTMFTHYSQTYDNTAGSYDLTFDYVLTVART